MDLENIETIGRPTGMRREDDAGRIRVIAVTYERRANPNGQPGFINLPVDHLVYDGTDRVEAARIEERARDRMYEPNPA